MKRLLMVLIILILVLIPNTNVHAVRNSFYEGEYIKDAYIAKKKEDTVRYQQMRVFRRNGDNQAVYCIELWEELESNKLLDGYEEDQYIHGNISLDIWSKIAFISYYGYGYENHTDIKWYAITQFMIWQIIQPDSEIYFTDTLNGNRITKYQDEINEINTLINNHTIRPSFHHQTFEITYDEKLILTDNNNVLDKYEITNKQNLELTTTNNQLTIGKNTIGKSQLIFTKKDKIYNNYPIVYVDSSGQDILAPGSYYRITSSVNINLPSSTIIINKLDQDNKTNIEQGDASLSGSKFQLLDVNNQVIDEKEIGEDKILKFENIGYGKYYIKEIKTGEGYLINNDIISLNVDESIENIDFYNQVIKNKIKFYKYIKNPLTGITKQEKNAIFSIYNKNQKIITFTTNELGFYELELPYGTYTVKQESGAKNHLLIEDFEINVTINGKTQKFDLYNEELTANIKIINTDSESNLPILESGAVFEIRNINTSEKYAIDTNLGITDYLILSSGNYEIKQLNSINGYYINENVFSFQINDEIEFNLDENNNKKYLEIIISNEKKKSKIEIEMYKEYYLNDELVKKEKTNIDQVLIYAKVDIYSKDNLKLFIKDEVVTTAKLENNKLITPYLNYGNYYIKKPNDNTITDIIIDDLEIKKVELINRIHEYKEEVIENKNIEIKPEVLDTSIIEEDLIDNKDIEIITDIPNTLLNKQFFSNININTLLIALGLFIIRKEKRNEKN